MASWRKTASPGCGCRRRHLPGPPGGGCHRGLPAVDGTPAGHRKSRSRQPGGLIRCPRATPGQGLPVRLQGPRQLSAGAAGGEMARRRPDSRWGPYGVGSWLGDHALIRPVFNDCCQGLGAGSGAAGGRKILVQHLSMSTAPGAALSDHGLLRVVMLRHGRHSTYRSSSHRC